LSKSSSIFKLYRRNRCSCHGCCTTRNCIHTQSLSIYGFISTNQCHNQFLQGPRREGEAVTSNEEANRCQEGISRGQEPAGSRANKGQEVEERKGGEVEGTQESAGRRRTSSSPSHETRAERVGRCRIGTSSALSARVVATAQSEIRRGDGTPDKEWGCRYP
jgi:hypothetical protein